MNEVDVANVGLSMYIMFVVGGIGAAIISVTKYEGYAKLWAILWTGPPLIVLWGKLVTYIVMT